jgi:hypothetical protein
MALALVVPSKGSDGRSVAIGFALVFVLLALSMFRMGRKLARAGVTIAPDRLTIRAHEFRVWGLRRAKHAELTWNQVTGLEVFETPNPYAPEGVQRDFVVHTDAGKFALSNVVFPDARAIAEQIAARISRPIGDVTNVVEPISIDRPSDRVGIGLMRAFGWVAMACGVLFAGCATLVAFNGKPDSLSMAAKVGMMSGVLLTCGAAMRRFQFKQPKPGA